MLGGNYYKRKLDKKARKKEAKKERRGESSGGKVGGDRSAGGSSSGSGGGGSGSNNAQKVKFLSGSSLKGPVVAHNLGGDGGRDSYYTPSRDSANNKHNVPFTRKSDEKFFLKKQHLDSVGPHTKSSGASSAAQRRRVLKMKKDDDLLDHFREKLNASTFRLLNEQVYNSPTAFAAQLLKDKETFAEYHTGYRQQLAQWPMNPNQLIIDALLGDKRGRLAGNKGKNMPGHIPPNWVIADMGCGDAQIAVALQAKGYCVHSFDFCALNSNVTVADTSSVPLPDSSVDVCVFSLSLMATDYERSLFEAFRILKPNRLLKIVEVRSRIPFPRRFAELVEAIGFTTDHQDVAGDYFVAFDFLKKDGQPEANKTLPHRPGDVLMPSMYKKR